MREQGIGAVTRSFCVTEGTWKVIMAYARANECSYSEALRSLVRIADRELNKKV